MPKALDITGKRFGKLTALSKAKNRGKKTYWLCQCDCGNQKEVQTSHLTSGAIFSCGCLRMENNDNYEEKECLICRKKFIPNNNQRLYCYECSPKGASAADAVRLKKKALKHLLVACKGGKCQKCGYDKCEGALQFHHRDPKEKEFSISHINLNETTFSLDRIFQEVDKCDLLCANCHAEIHYIEEE